MAVAGLHNLSAFGPSFFSESQSPRPRTRASSLLQMWRGLEGDHVVSHSHRSSQTNSLSSGSDGSSSPTSEGGMSDDETVHGLSGNASITSETENQDNNSVTSELSIELGENERERVRRTFQEWMNCGAANHSSNGICSGSQIEIGRQRRPFRKICGRQPLLDLLVRAQCERKKELEGLLGQKPVSEFVYRNRIQALLRGRFLRNERPLPDNRPSSVAATELGLLRERNTVSGLREGFLSKLDNSAFASVNITNGTTDEERREIIIETHTTSDPETAADEDTSRQELASQVTGIENSFSEHDLNVQEEVYLDNATSEQVSHEELILDREETEQEDIINSVTITNELPSHVEINSQNEPGGNNSEQSGLPDATSSRSWQERPTTNNQWFQNPSDIEGVGQSQMQESQAGEDLQEAIDNWLDMPTGEVDGASVETAPAFYFPDDDEDNTQRLEIRELFSRRRVSSLLRSGFRESLDQVLRSHVERLGDNASGDWELDEASFSPSLDQQGTGQHNNDDDRALSQSEAGDGYLFAPTASTLATESQPIWGFELQSEDLLPNHPSQQLGMGWEVVNELRADIARLQQRLNNMECMLEQCMDMQIELHRSVRQEVSAALNRSILTRDESKGNTRHDGSEWDYVRKGICCLCRDSKIDSLLYRCGHMCTCSKCAETLVHGSGKCPMCQAPVVESIRAYFIQ